MQLDLKLVKENANIFGTPVYESTGIVYGTVKPGEYTIDANFNSIRVDLGDGTFISASLKGMKAVDVDATKAVFSLEQFIATRDTKGDETFRAITAGTKKDFATLVA